MSISTSNWTKETSFKMKNGGDLVWKALMVLLLGLIGAAAGFAYIYGLVSRDEKVTAKVSLLLVWRLEELL